MATYIILANFTEQGIRNVKDTTKRADTFRDMAQKAGATVKELYWTLGAHDVRRRRIAGRHCGHHSGIEPWHAWQRTHPDAPRLFERRHDNHSGQNGIAEAVEGLAERAHPCFGSSSNLINA